MAFAQPGKPSANEIQLVVELKYLKHDATPAEVTARLAEARTQLRQYAAERKLQQQARPTEIRYIAVVYRAWELEALEEIKG